MALWVITVLTPLMLTELYCARLELQLAQLKHQCRLKAKRPEGDTHALMKTGTGEATPNAFQGRQSQFAGDIEREREKRERERGCSSGGEPLRNGETEY